MKNDHDVLKVFLNKALASKRERLMVFLSKPKSHHKFFEMLCHELGDYFSDSVQVAELPSQAWSSSAIAFVGRNGNVTRHDTLREAWENVDKFQGALVISRDSCYGIWCDHEKWDDKIFVSIKNRNA